MAVTSIEIHYSDGRATTWTLHPDDKRIEAVERLLTGRTRPPRGLTTPQKEVLPHIAAGLSNHEIATLLGVSQRTVESRLVSLYKRLDISPSTGGAGRAEAIRKIRHYAEENGYL